MGKKGFAGKKVDLAALSAAPAPLAKTASVLQLHCGQPCRERASGQSCSETFGGALISEIEACA